MNLKSSEKNIEIKICGITKREEIDFLNNRRIDYIGFVFCKSKRQVDIEVAKLLGEKSNKKIVGVFKDNRIEFIKAVVDRMDLDVIQLHGEEERGFILDLRRFFKGEIWKAIKMKNINDTIEANKSIADRILLDGINPGSGEMFNHNLLKAINRSFILAGGLTPSNIKKILERGGIEAIDVSSGVERNGIKDMALVDLFLREVEK